ncbi:MAG: DNRLRE domain-containing protein [Armatimonadetes bacterium]|nr:DNRLRE domain-containing protein [Armatimonadota bacterium]
MTWNSQPSSDAAAISSVSVNAVGWESWTITSLVASRCNGSDSNNGVLVKQSSGFPLNNVQFYSSDFVAAMRPLTVRWPGSVERGVPQEEHKAPCKGAGDLGGRLD